MADHFLALLPADPHAPLPDAANALRDALAQMLGTNEARVKDYGKLQFIDCGQNFRAVHCPACKAEIPVPTWHDWMEQDWHGTEGFHLHKHTAPCCGTDVTLNTVTYDAPQGFAHWFVSARLSKPQALTNTQNCQLEQIAGFPLKPILQHY